MRCGVAGCSPWRATSTTCRRRCWCLRWRGSIETRSECCDGSRCPDNPIARRLCGRPGRRARQGAWKGERLHYWVFNGPWSYAEEPSGEASGVDKEIFDEGVSRTGAIIGGRSTYDAAEAWGGENPWDTPLFVLTHRTEDEPADGGFSFVSGLESALEQARTAAGDKDVGIMGGADTIRQALAGGHVDDLIVTIAPVVLGGGKRLFEGFDRSVDLQQVEARQSEWATHLRYRVRK
jgi:dihydrofolate reductase